MNGLRNRLVFCRPASGLVLMAGLLACAPAYAQRAEVLPVPASQSPAMVLGQASDNFAAQTEALVNAAMNRIGTSWRWRSGEKLAGFDASTFVSHVFKDALGFVLPVGVENLGRVGESIRTSELKPGDLVFFNTMRRTFSHVGIYLGNDKFVHAPARGAELRVDDLQSTYWDRRFEGARRILVKVNGAPGQPTLQSN